MSDAPPPPPPPPPVGPPPGYQPYEGGVPSGPPKTDGMAIAALVLGILAIPLCLSIFAAVPAIILGKISMNRIAASGGTLKGAGMAKTGFILGIVFTVLAVIGLIFLVTS